MAHIVFILGSYYPDILTTSKCADNIIQVIKEKHEVTVICLKNKFELVDKEVIGNVDVFRVDTTANKVKTWVESKSNLKGQFSKKLINTVKSLERLFSLGRFVFKKSSIDQALVKKFVTALKIININKKIDVIIPISLPFEGLTAAQEYKREHKLILLIPYLFDPFSDNVSLHRFPWLKSIRDTKHKSIETKVFCQSDKIFAINHLLKLPIIEAEGVFKEKLIVTEHPVLIKPDQTTKINKIDKGIINLTYTGALYLDIRNPSYLMELLERMSILEFDYKMNMYTFGNCEGILQKYKSVLKDKLALYGKVSLSESHSALNISHILISIGNTTNTQTPSKIFEYMSFGKPIVHLYDIEDDMVVETLNRYPLALCLRQDQDSLEENARKIIDFCKENTGKQISFEKCSEIYYDATPKYIAKQFDEYICSALTAR